MSDLPTKLRALAQTPVLLVASDFDGTLAPIVSDPALARANPDAVRALEELAALPHTHAAIISGRSREYLGGVTSPGARVTLIGSHGVESEFLPPPRLTEPQRELLSDLTVELADIARADPGFLVEQKPFGVAFHYRNAPPAAAQAAFDRVMAGPAAREGVHVRLGAMVVELVVVRGDKGQALAALRHRLGATGALFVGDDLTDEDAFGALGPGDLSVKVGHAPTVADERVPDTDAVAALLSDLLDLRREWLARQTVVPIERHAILSDQRTVAVVTPAARIVWLCLPRLDSSALFAELIDGPNAGFFEVASPDGRPPISQRYEPDTFILRTRWPGFTVTDYFDCSGGRPYQRAGRSDLIRVIEPDDSGGPARVAVRFAPRLDFGRIETRLILRDGGVEIDGSQDPIVLYAPGVRWRILDDGRHHTAVAELDLSGGPVVLELRYGTASLRPPTISEAQRRAHCHDFWAGWAATLRVPAHYPDLVRRAALTIKALCYGPSGAIAAAATTSLPEHFGGSRNWDYRFCWPRDAALAGAALVRLGSTGHAIKLLDWLLAIVDQCETPDRLRPIYTVTGGFLGPEAEIPELAGYGHSRPVRISNAAAAQVQLDVFGPITDLVALLAEAGAPVSPDHWRLVRAMVEAVALRWRDADHGIWEIRGPRQHHVHSKVMCWHTVSRALMIEELLLSRRNPVWERLRDEIARDVLANGFNTSVGAFTGAYGTTELDAAALHVGLTGLLPPDDARFRSTVDAIERHLLRGSTVYRYAFDDGLPGIEGGFNLCTTWLIESYILLGRLRDAEELLARYVSLAGPLGLFAEEHEPRYNIALGNFPQAYSHLGLINAAVRLHEASMARG